MTGEGQRGLGEVIAARLDAWEAAARAAGGAAWNAKWGGLIAAGYGSPMDGEQIAEAVDTPTTAHIALNDPAAVLAMVAGLRAVVALAGQPAPPTWDGENYEGRVGGTDHRTTGGRAWCYQCSEWCYPKSYACPCCEPPIERDDLLAAIAAMWDAPGSGLGGSGDGGE